MKVLELGNIIDVFSYHPAEEKILGLKGIGRYGYSIENEIIEDIWDGGDYNIRKDLMYDFNRCTFLNRFKTGNIENLRLNRCVFNDGIEFSDSLKQLICYDSEIPSIQNLKLEQYASNDINNIPSSLKILYFEPDDKITFEEDFKGCEYINLTLNTKNIDLDKIIKSKIKNISICFKKFCRLSEEMKNPYFKQNNILFCDEFGYEYV
jgi:hypothetical protein